MLYTVFNENGYIIKSDEWKETLSNTEGYNWLFDFLSLDLLKISNDLEEQKTILLDNLKRIQKSTFIESELNTQAKKLEVIHPFYKKSISQENHPFFQLSEGVKYLVEEVLFKLFDELSINSNESEMLNNINKYSNVIDFFNKDNINYLLMMWYSRKASTQNLYNKFLGDLIALQSELRSWSFIFLDIDAKYLNQLSKRERISMYGFYSNSILNINKILERSLNNGRLINNKPKPDIAVTENLYFSNVENNVSMFQYNGKEVCAPGQIETQLKILINLQMAYINPENKDVENDLKLIVENYNKNFTTDNYLVREIVSHSILVLLKYEFSKLIDNELMIRKCRTCGRYFIINNNKSFYCTRMNEEIGKRCCDENPKKRHVSKLKKLGIYQEYNEINNKILYRSKQKYKFREELFDKQKELSRIKEKLMKYADIEVAKESDYYKEFFKLYEEIRSVLENIK